MSTPPPAAEKHEIRPLTGVRGAAALWVVCFHGIAYWLVLFPSLRPFAPFSHQGHFGVALFFILSGFIISYVYSAAQERFSWGDYRRFLWMRFARIYPNHFVTLTLLVAMVAAALYFKVNLVYSSYPWSGLPYQYTMTQSWPFAKAGAWNLPAWSIGAEWFAYIFMFPISVFLLRKIRNQWALLITALVVLNLQRFTGNLTQHLDYERAWAIPMVCCDFIAGSLFFGVYQRKGWIVEKLQQYATWIFVALVAITAKPFSLGFWERSIILVLMAFLLVGLTSERSAIGRILATPLWVWLGRISYAIYLTHSFAMQGLRFITPPDRYADSGLLVRAGVLMSNLALIILLGALLYYLVEAPSRNWLRHLVRPRKPAAAPMPPRPDLQKTA